MAPPSNATHTLKPFVHDEGNTENKKMVLPIPTSSLKIVSASYKEAPTGLTLFMFPPGSYAANDLRGGSPGHLFNQDGPTEAIVLSGGSLLGLECGTGVSGEIWAARGYNSGWTSIPLVKGAIIYDYSARRHNSFYPDNALGRAAAVAALKMPEKPTNTFFLGQCGAGYSASCGKSLVNDAQEFVYCELAGQGAGFRKLGKKPRATVHSGPENDVWIAAFVVVNAVGHIVDRTGRTVRGHVDPVVIDAGLPITPETKRLTAAELMEKLINGKSIEDTLIPMTPASSTNISLVVTNLKLSPEEVVQLGRQIHASMGRGIQPIANMFDGDQLWCVSTHEVENSRELGTDFGTTVLGVAGGEAMWDAILNSF